MTYYIVNKDFRPITIFHGGDGPRVRISKKECVTFSTELEANNCLTYLKESGIKTNLHVSPYADF